MALQVSDVVSLARIFLNDPSSTGRWSDASLISFVNEASQEIIRDVEFPEGRYTTITQANLQEYPLPDLVKIYRVYVAGQLVVPTTISSLEGDTTQDYDQNLNSGIPSQGAPVAGGGGPQGNSGDYSPAWTVQVPVDYPLANSWGSPAPDAQMWTAGQRPRYYMRGGSIGLVPAPASQYALVVDFLPVPANVAALTDTLLYPNNFRQALAWKVCEMAFYSDDGDRAADQRAYASGQYEKQMRKLRTTRKMYDGPQPRMPKPRTYRRGRQIGNVRNGQGLTEYP